MSPSLSLSMCGTERARAAGERCRSATMATQCMQRMMVRGARCVYGADGRWAKMCEKRVVAAAVCGMLECIVWAGDEKRGSNS